MDTVFLKEFIKKDILIDENTHIEVGDLGIKENILLQQKENNKAMGVFDDKHYYFGATNDFSYSHDWMQDNYKVLNPDSSYAVYITCDRFRVTVDVMPYHTSAPKEKPTRNEYEIIKTILMECKSALREDEFRLKFSLSADQLVDIPEGENCFYAHTVEDIEKIVSWLKKPSEESNIKNDEVAESAKNTGKKSLIGLFKSIFS